MSPPLLEVRELATAYPVPRGFSDAIARRPPLSVRAVDGVSLTVSSGEVVALVGESGSGKTTLAQTIMRALPARGGTIRFEGEDITSLGARELRPLRRRMQMVYQDPYESLDPRFRVRRTVTEPLAVHGVGDRASREAQVRDALVRCGLDPPEAYLDRYPHELSGGQRQRVAIAAGIVLGPSLLIADEPVSMLDVSVRAGVLSVLGKLRRSGLGLLLITHDLSIAATFADRICVMYLGRIVEEGPARSVVADPRHPYTRALISVTPQRNGIGGGHGFGGRILSGEIPDATRIPGGCRFHPRCPVALDTCSHEDPSLRSPGAFPAVEHSAACVRA